MFIWQQGNNFRKMGSIAAKIIVHRHIHHATSMKKITYMFINSDKSDLSFSEEIISYCRKYYP
jgi:hypothetical protein